MTETIFTVNTQLQYPTHYTTSHVGLNRAKASRGLAITTSAKFSYLRELCLEILLLVLIYS